MSSARRQTFSAATRFAWLRLWRSENIGPRTFEKLLDQYRTAEAALEALPGLSRTASGRAIRVAEEEEIQAELMAAARLNARFVCRDEPDYPKLLREIRDAPPVIAVRGQSDVLDRPAIAIVGSRNASAAGLAFAERLARGLAQAGYVIVSGFARGIDSRAHRASLATGTIAVLAGGHDRLYPADQGPFLDKLLEDGAAISEMPFGWEARGRDFPRRNRIVSGLSLGVVVVEAARRSGSLITARFAADQGRDVFAVPGSPLDPRAEGTNDLIRDGAIFCTDPDDVIRALEDQRARPSSDTLFEPGRAAPERFWDELDLFVQNADSMMLPSRSDLEEAAADHDPVTRQPVVRGEHAASSAHRRSPLDLVIDGLGPSPVSIDELARATDLPIRDVRSAVLELEISGRIERHGGGLVSLLTT